MSKTENKKHLRFLREQRFQPNLGGSLFGESKIPTRRVAYTNHNAVCIYKRHGQWKVWIIGREETKAGPFPDTTTCYMYAQCEGWIND